MRIGAFQPAIAKPVLVQPSEGYRFAKITPDLYRNLYTRLRDLGMTDAKIDVGFPLRGNKDRPLEGLGDHELTPAEISEAYYGLVDEAQTHLLEPTAEQSALRQALEKIAGDLDLDLPFSVLIPGGEANPRYAQLAKDRQQLLTDLSKVMDQLPRQLGHSPSAVEKAMAVYTYLFEAPDFEAKRGEGFVQSRGIAYAFDQNMRPVHHAMTPLEAYSAGKAVCQEMSGLLYACYRVVGLEPTIAEPIAFKDGRLFENQVSWMHTFISLGSGEARIYIDPSAEFVATHGVLEGFDINTLRAARSHSLTLFVTSHYSDKYFLFDGKPEDYQARMIAVPDSFEAAQFFAEWAASKGDRKFAVNAYAQRYSDLKKDNEPTAVILNRIARLRGEIDPDDQKVVAAFDQALAQIPDDGSVYYKRGNLRSLILVNVANFYSVRHDFERFVSNLEAAIRFDPFQVDGNAGFKKLLSKYKPGLIPEPFDTRLRRALCSYFYAMTTYQTFPHVQEKSLTEQREQIVAWDPEGPYVPAMDAYLAEAKGDHIEAQLNMAKARRMDPENLHFIFAEIDMWLRMNHAEDAMKASAKLIEKFPKNYAYRVLHVRAALAANQIDIARRELKALDEFAEGPQLKYELEGHLALLENNLPRARQNLEWALTVAPQRAVFRLHMLLGRVAEGEGDLAKARDYYTKSLAVVPKYAAVDEKWRRIISDK